MDKKVPKLIRITTAPLSLKYLLPGQMRYMNEHGFEVIMVSSDGKELEEVVAKEGCPHHVVPMTRQITPLADLRSLWALYRFFKKEKPAIVHSHTPKAGLLAMLAARMAGIKIRIHTIAGLRFMTATGLTRKVLIVMEKLTAHAATHVWPNSQSLKQYILAEKLASPRKLDVIGEGSSNGINLSRFSALSLKGEKLNEIKQQIGFNGQYTYFVTVGRIVKDKGIDELAKAFAAIYEANKQVRLILVGSFEDDLDPVSDDARKLLKEHPGIIQAGWNDAPEYFMHLSYALVHPSHREGFPNVLLQAGAMNCPVICSIIEGNIDIVEHQHTGLLFEVKNREQLRQSMERALADPAQLRVYAANLRKKIERSFDQRVVHQRLNECYRDLVNSGS